MSGRARARRLGIRSVDARGTSISHDAGSRRPPPDPRSREFEGDVHLQPLGEWQRFKYRKLFEMILAGSAARGAADDGLLRVDDFLEVLLWRYSPSGSAAANASATASSLRLRAVWSWCK